MTWNDENLTNDQRFGRTDPVARLRIVAENLPDLVTRLGLVVHDLLNLLDVVDNAVGRLSYFLF